MTGFVNVYGPRDFKERVTLWKNIELLCNKEEVKWCVFGDFNEVRGNHERLNSIMNEKGAEEFNKFISNNRLVEIPLGGQKFTRVSDDGRKHSKLDRFLVSNDFYSKWSNLGVKALERRWSDHCPIMLEEAKLDYGPKPFKLFNYWLSGEGLEDTIREEWNKEVTSKTPDCVFRDKLKSVKHALKRRSGENYKKLHGELEKNKEEVKK